MTTHIQQIRKSFGSFEALKSISLSIEKGEFIAILGPSGCGKTTLLRLIAGFDSPTDGEISIDGELAGAAHYSSPPEKRNIGMVFQSFALWPHLSVRKQVEFPIQHHPHASKEMKAHKEKRAEEVLKLVGLGHLADRMPNELSGGQKQRVALARALAHEPALLLMDEPLSSLDAELREDMRREIQTIHRMTGSSILYVTHDQGEALAMADRIVIMKDGRIEQIGAPEDIYLRPATPFVAGFVGKATMIEGTWTNDTFKPAAAPEVTWSGQGIHDSFRQDDMYPVRPDQWILTEDTQNGIPATITNVLYQGKDIHYTVKAANNQQISFIQPIHTRYQIGEQVTLAL
ncbi:ABC transporter ATP-binding protein [Jeotgalibacillus sp. R-1-5s-1]|uniref:ABC transporter ATP-binding protein n=1 Tax=Jeotgalibacillus sp. R-1-5s-1 TaxID=2555897 RepID=UPI00106970EF|nr:ABC transporter ATP-binding protein [Jeotgalibacillus sp. R-1-5s-1]TFD96620.1 ABC transporter ATP-binding protein [Jeotgalibacillus sp. R-1-5s-1]